MRPDRPDAPVEPGYYTVTASFAGNGNYHPASATATITIVLEAQTLTDLSKAFKAGRTIPIKIQLTDAAGNNVSSPDVAVAAIRLERVNADGTRTPVSLQDAGGANPDEPVPVRRRPGRVRLQPEHQGARGRDLRPDHCLDARRRLHRT